MTRLLRASTAGWGAAMTAFGLAHVLAGSRSVPGMRGAGPTADSQMRYAGALCIVDGVAYVWAARQDEIPRQLLRFLAATTLVGALGRTASIATTGRPSRFFLYVGLPTEYLNAALTWWLAEHRDGRRRLTVA